MSKKLTMMIAVAFVAIAMTPLASAHWRGVTDAIDPTLQTIAYAHPHLVVGPGSVDAGWYWGQRLCVGPALGQTTASNPDGLGCPAGSQPVPPFRGLGLGTGDCEDADLPPTVGQDVLGFLGSIGTSQTSVTLDWGAASIGTTTSSHGWPGGVYSPGTLTAATSVPPLAPRVGPQAFSDAFGNAGPAPNPTGSSTSNYPGFDYYPGYLAVGTGPLLSQTQTGLGVDATGTSVSTIPPGLGIDLTDNDFETGVGVACHTYAIDSGANTWTSGTPAWGPVAAPVLGLGAGSRFNDPRGIGGDDTYDVLPPNAQIDSRGGFTAASVDPVVLGLPTATPPSGFLVSVLVPLPGPTTAVTYSLCNSMAGAGCTNIPHGDLPGDFPTGTRFGAAPGINLVYSSLADCVSDGGYPTRVNGKDGLAYSGTAAVWGTATPSGFPCWPERLASLTGAAGGPGTLYVPESQAAGGAFNPDWLPASPSANEGITVFFGGAGTFPALGVQHCTPGTSPVTGCNPVTQTGLNNPPTDWVKTPSFAVLNSAVFV